jgi:hypothetical protein
MPTNYETQVASLNPVFWYKFDETSGTPANSGSATGYTLTTEGSPTLNQASGVSNKSVYFNGSSGYNITGTMPTNLFNDKAFTVEAWIKVENVNAEKYATILRMDNDTSGAYFGLRLLGTDAAAADRGKIQAYIQGGSGYAIAAGNTDKSFDNNEWNQIALVVNGGNVKIYVNGKFSKEFNYNVGTTLSFDNSQTVRKIGWNTLEDFIGYMDEFAIYTSALTDAQIEANFQAKELLNTYESTVKSFTPRIWMKHDSDSDSLPSNYGSRHVYVNKGINFPQATTGKTGGALAFTGNSETTGRRGYSIVKATAGADINASWSMFDDSVFTIETWFKQNGRLYSNSSNPTIVQLKTNSLIGVQAFIPAAGQPNVDKLCVNFVGTSGSNGFVSTDSYVDNAWHHLVIVASANNNYKVYIDGSLKGTITTSISFSTFDANAFMEVGGGPDNARPFFGDVDDVIFYNSALSAENVTSLYNSANAVSINYTNTSGATASADIPMPTHTAETVINVTYISDVLGTASADIVHPELSASSNLDAFGVATASSDIVNPTIVVDKNNDYAADPSTASALMTAAVITTTKAVNYSASPATVSALFGANVYAGQTVQDTNYEFNVRRFNSIANQATIQQMIDGTMTSGNWSVNSRLAIKQVSGVPTYNQIIKARLRVDSPFYTYSSNLGNPRFNIYVFTSAPKNGKTFDTMLTADMPDKELIYTTRTNDDLSNGTGAEDLTQALQDSRAATYGIMIELAQYDQNGNNLADGYYAWTWAASNYTEITKDWFYILTSEFTSKNINSDPMSVTNAEMTAASVYVERYVNFQDGVAECTATSVMPTIITEGTVNFPADPSTASALAVQPILDFGTEVEASPMIAFADTYTVVVSATKNVNIQVDPSTVSALLHMPQPQIGDEHTADHMNASALFVNPLVVINESVDAMTTTASATMTDATVAGQLLGITIAAPMIANVMSPNPPAYIDLFGDKWYATLYAQHSVRNQLPAGYNTSFLKLFEDQNTDITQSTPNTYIESAKKTLRQLRNNLTHGIVVNSGPENDGNFFPVSTAITDYSTPTNESRLSVGYFDPYGRKAVRFQNIAVQMLQPLGHARTDFTIEFSMKTTKANQVISSGIWTSPTGPGSVRTTFNLVDGKLNFYTRSGYNVTHPKEILTLEQIAINSGYDSVTGNTRIDDGQWHHVVMQYRQGPEDAGDVSVAGRTQIWVDGNLDIQRFGQRLYEPDFIGANLELSTYAPDFYTSVWSVDSSFISERDIDLHYFDYIKYQPILAEPMTASLTMTQDNTGVGNRGRALMLYWWPTSSGQNKNFITSRFDGSAGQGEFDINMFDNDLQTLDFIKNPPQKYYGWDIFPVDITGYFVSDLVKEQAYGGPQNIIEQDLGGAVDVFGGPRPKFKANRMGYFRNTVDDTRRYIDLVNDIDLSKFDAIMFKNYPDQSNEIDAFARNEYVDPYFEIRETKIYQDFIKSLRAAVDTGISLMVNNPQLALDLKIVDRIEVVPDLTDGTGYYSDPYTPTIVPSSAASLPVSNGGTSNLWTDTYRNNRIRVINTVPGVTDEPSIIYTDAAYWNNDDSINYGGANRPFKGFTHKPNGLAVGDEFFISTFNFGNPSQYGGGGSVPRNYLATPISSVLAGTPVTAFANQYRRGLNLVDNPYNNYVTSIAIKPGDVLDGRQVGGKIWVNFTDAINQENDYVSIDGIHSYWINLAYQEGSISLDIRNQLLASGDLLENKLNNNEITQQEYNLLSKWHQNGMYILASATQLEIEGGKSDFSGDKLRTERVTKTSKSGIATNRAVSFGGQFFAFTYARQFFMLAFEAISMNTRGFRWLSNRVADVSQTQAHVAMPASAAMVQPTVIAVRDTSENAPAMIANAIHVDAVGFTGGNRNILSLPMTATALITQPVRIVSVEPMTATADTRQDIVIRTTAQDQVVVYVLHEDPILYLREDIIK